MNFPQFPRRPSFDKQLGEMQKRGTSLIGVAFVAWIVYACLCLAAVGAVVYVAIHFLAKFW